MRFARSHLSGLILLLVLGYAAALSAQAPKQAPLYQQFLSPATPLEIVAAKHIDRVAWMAYEEGRRNVYTAAAPAFSPVRLTSFVRDDGVDLSTVRISDDGAIVTFVRGTQPNRDGWIANASANPDGADRTLWAVRTAGGPAWRLGEVVGAPELAPDGRSVLFVKDDQIYRYLVARAASAGASKGDDDTPFITAWGAQSTPKWSPNGRKIAFVSTRTDHSFVVVYDVATRKITYMSPSVDFDSSPMWTEDGKHVLFVRRPGLAFGQQAQQGVGSLGNPNGPAFNPNSPTGRGGRGQGGPPFGGQGRGQVDSSNVPPAAASVPGLTRATFKGGHTLSIMKGDVATGEARELWHNEPNDRLVSSLNNVRLAGDRIIFPFNVSFGGGRGGRGTPPPEEQPAGPVDEWERYYALDISLPSARPVLLTTTDGLIEGQTDVALSPDGKTLYYCTNAKDIERRHIWAVPVAGGTPQQVTTGEGIETYPTPLASGKTLATLSAGWKLPQSVGLWPLDPAVSQDRRIIFPSLKGWRAADLHVEPELVITKAADGVEVHNQLFVPRDIKPGERRPAIIFVHGGPVRQMLLGYHYMHFYHWAYGINQWLASQGYVVMSVNYRSGIGYGRSFRTAPNTGGRGNAEYQDVVAGGKYLQSRADVDPARVGIWGLSYGGVLTAQALARNSDIFRAGVDLAGVHLWGSTLDPDATSYRSSVVGAIDGWKSPVLLVHGDDDRNVAFQQTTGLVQLLRQRDVEFELIVFPDDTHESMLHSRWIYTFERMERFLDKHLRAAGSRITTERR